MKDDTSLERVEHQGLLFYEQKLQVEPGHNQYEADAVKANLSSLFCSQGKIARTREGMSALHCEQGAMMPTLQSYFTGGAGDKHGTSLSTPRPHKGGAGVKQSQLLNEYISFL